MALIHSPEGTSFAFANKSGLISSRAVSYTLLDVYKRQLFGSAVNGESVFDGKFFQISRAAKIRPVGKLSLIHI